MLLKTIKVEDKEIMLVGTAHISKESIDLVNKSIEEFKPEVIGVELDSERFHQLMFEEQWQQMNVMNAISEGKTYLLLLNLLLASFQRKLGSDVGVKPGSEMKEAILLAQQKGLKLALLDRSVRITLKRALGEMTLFEKLKLFIAFVQAMFGFDEEITKEKIEQLKQQDLMTQLMNELGRQMPSVKKVLVDERDIFIANSILSLPEKRILAVVGAGHLDGITKYLDKKRDVRELLTVKEKKSILSLVKWLIPIIFFLILFLTFQFKGFNAIVNALLAWILATGVFAALGALIAKANWKTIIVSFILAPLTTLHPLLAAGWFAALIEAKINTPQIKDFESMKDLKSYSDFNKNKVTHLLLVAAYTNIGATIGTIIVLPYLIAMLG